MYLPGEGAPPHYPQLLVGYEGRLESARSGVGKLQPGGQVWPTACFQKFLFKPSHAHLFTHWLLSGLHHGDELSQLSVLQSLKYLLSGPLQNKFADLSAKSRNSLLLGNRPLFMVLGT